MADEFNIKTLHKAMIRSLDVDDLRTICQYLSINPQCKGLLYSDLEGVGITGKSLSLIEYCQKKRALTALIITINEDWPVTISDRYEQWLVWAKKGDVESDGTQNQEKGQTRWPSLEPAKIWIIETVIAETYDELRKAESTSNWDAAIELGEKILRFDNNQQDARTRTAIAYDNRGCTFFNLKQYSSALTDFNRAIQLDPAIANIHVNLGNVYHSMQHYKQAITSYTHAIQINAKYYDAYAYRGHSFYHIEQYEYALNDLGDAIQLQPTSANFYYMRGLVHKAAKSIEEAKDDFQRAASLGHEEAIAELTTYNELSD